MTDRPTPDPGPAVLDGAAPTAGPAVLDGAAGQAVLDGPPGSVVLDGVAPTAGPAAGGESLRRRVEALQWYHTFELAPGVVTPGWFDTRPVLDRLPFPEDLSGKRCLDVGSFDGFWAFAMEQRGASEVVAIDVPDPEKWDWPANSPRDAVASVSSRQPGAGFSLVAETLGSRVRRRELSVYDLDPALVGTFDFVYVGSLLLHLRDPIGALARVRRVCTGSLLVVDAVETGVGLPGRPRASLDGVGRPWWWKPNLPGLVRMVEAAGFRAVPPFPRLRIPAGAGQQRPKPSPLVLRNRASRQAAVRAWYGDPHAAVSARPA